MGGTSTNGRFISWSQGSPVLRLRKETGIRRLWGFEVEARYWVLRLHAHPWSFGAMVCVAGPPCHWVSADAGLVVVWGCSLRTA